MNEDTTQIVKKLLASPQKVVIVGHKNPDGDAVGSCLGLSLFLKSLGHSTTVIMPNDFPDFLKWLPGVEEIISPREGKRKKHRTNKYFRFGVYVRF